jgi:hypothetical protein
MVSLELYIYSFIDSFKYSLVSYNIGKCRRSDLECAPPICNGMMMMVRLFVQLHFNDISYI